MSIAIYCAATCRWIFFEGFRLFRIARGGLREAIQCQVVLPSAFSSIFRDQLFIETFRPPISRLSYRTRLSKGFQRIIPYMRISKARFFLLRPSFPSNVVYGRPGRWSTKVEPYLVTRVNSIHRVRSHFLFRFAHCTLLWYLTHLRRSNCRTIRHSLRIANVSRRR